MTHIIFIITFIFVSFNFIFAQLAPQDAISNIKRGINLGNGTWGKTSDINQIRSKFLAASNWSKTNNIPVIISEFGAVRDCNYNSRMIFYATYVEEALLNNIPFQIWDDGGNFKIYERENRTWDEVKDILIYANPEGPTSLSYTLNSESSITINWQNLLMLINSLSS